MPGPMKPPTPHDDIKEQLDRVVRLLPLVKQRLSGLGSDVPELLDALVTVVLILGGRPPAAEHGTPVAHPETH